MSIYTYIRFKTSQDMIILGQRHNWIKMDTFLLFSSSLLQEKRCEVWGVRCEARCIRDYDLPSIILMKVHAPISSHIWNLTTSVMHVLRSVKRKAVVDMSRRVSWVWDPYKTMLYTLWSLHYYARIIWNTLQRNIQTLISLYRAKKRYIYCSNKWD
jgi:hypothetical protein